MKCGAAMNAKRVLTTPLCDEGVVILEGLERFGPVAFPSPEKFIWT